MQTLKKAWTYLVIVLVALVASVNYELFIFPNQFAPSGVNGICTMIQYVSGISVGYLSLLINVPLAIWCYCEVSKPIALRSMLYVVTFSLGLLLLAIAVLGGGAVFIGVLGWKEWKKGKAEEAEAQAARRAEAQEEEAPENAEADALPEPEDGDAP